MDLIPRFSLLLLHQPQDLLKVILHPGELIDALVVLLFVVLLFIEVLDSLIRLDDPDLPLGLICVVNVHTLQFGGPSKSLHLLVNVLDDRLDRLEKRRFTGPRSPVRLLDADVKTCTKSDEEINGRVVTVDSGLDWSVDDPVHVAVELIRVFTG